MITLRFESVNCDVLEWFCLRVKGPVGEAAATAARRVCAADITIVEEDDPEHLGARRAAN